MDELTNFIQNGGGDAMNLINNQKGGAVQIVILAFNVMVPVIFFLVYYFWHLGLDDDRAEEYTGDDEDEADGDGKKWVVWGKFSIKVILFMIFLSFIFGWVISFYLGKPGIGTGGTPVRWWWKLVFACIAISGVVSIIKGGLRSTAYQYFNDELYDNRTKLEKTCIDFGCGFAPYDTQEVKRGANYTD
tara:strand:+ start:49 stop:612 length:564 start_codon:yes stop_codon:yes gene_type:complete